MAVRERVLQGVKVRANEASPSKFPFPFPSNDQTIPGSHPCLLRISLADPLRYVIPHIWLQIY